MRAPATKHRAFVVQNAPPEPSVLHRRTTPHQAATKHTKPCSLRGLFVGHASTAVFDRTNVCGRFRQFQRCSDCIARGMDKNFYWPIVFTNGFWNQLQQLIEPVRPSFQIVILGSDNPSSSITVIIS
jgi:hypothetical protein